jgi:hypothetical protein
MPSDTPSGLTRYDAGAIAMGLGEGDDGESTDYVRYSDVASLEEENKRLERHVLLAMGMLGNVDHSQGNGPNAAKMGGEMLNDIRDILRAALSEKGET